MLEENDLMEIAYDSPGSLADNPPAENMYEESLNALTDSLAIMGRSL